MKITNKKIKEIIKEELVDAINDYRKEVTDTMKKASKGDQQSAQDLLNASEKGIPGFKFNVIDGTKMEKSSIAKAYNLSGDGNEKNQKGSLDNATLNKVVKQQNSIVKQNSQDLKQNAFPNSGNVPQKYKELMGVFQSVVQIQQNCFQVLSTLLRAKKIPGNMAMVFAKTLKQYGKVYNNYMDKSNVFFDEKIKKIEDQREKAEASINLLDGQINASKKMLGYYKKILGQIDGYDGD
jgi:hypothetical protein